MKTLKQFIADNGVTLESVQLTDSNPNMDSPKYEMHHWRVTLKHGDAETYTRREMALVFSKGIGHHGAEPTLEEVLDCLATDSAGIENARGFEDWAGEYGYDTDSRKAERTFRACEEQAKSLRELLGDDAYEELLWETERE